jgi:hypothetical protein
MGAQGTATLDFGAFPGASDASVAVTGQAGILAGSLVEAWILPAATADHSADEHRLESLRIVAGNIIAGTGFTIYGVNTSEINEPSAGQFLSNPGSRGGPGRQDKQAANPLRGTRIYGTWNIGWVWN